MTIIQRYKLLELLGLFVRLWSLGVGADDEGEDNATENCETRGSRGLRLLDPGIDFALRARRPLRPPDM